MFYEWGEVQAIQLNLQLVGVYYSRGYIYNLQGKYDQAIADFTQAFEINPSIAIIHLALGVAYETAGHISEAVEAYRAFIKYAPPQDPYIEVAKQKIRELER